MQVFKSENDSERTRGTQVLNINWKYRMLWWFMKSTYYEKQKIKVYKIWKLCAHKFPK